MSDGVKKNKKKYKEILMVDQQVPSLSQIYKSLDIKKNKLQQLKTISQTIPLVELYNQVLQDKTQKERQEIMNDMRSKIAELTGSQAILTPQHIKKILSGQHPVTKLRQKTATDLRRYLVSYLQSSYKKGIRQLFQESRSTLPLLAHLTSFLEPSQKQQLRTASSRTSTRIQQIKSYIKQFRVSDDIPHTHRVAFIQSELPKYTKLTSLDLSNCNLRLKGMRILNRVSEQLYRLTFLNLSRNDLGRGAIRKQLLARVLRRLPNLASLDLSGNDLGLQGIDALAPVLRQLRKLTSLDLSNNAIGIEGMHHLVLILQQLPNLTFLALGFNQFRDEGIEALAPVLQQLHKLTSLDLSYNNIGVEGMQHLAPVLGELHDLTFLDLRGYITTEVIRVLAPVLGTLHNLTRLLFDRNIDVEGKRILLNIFSTLPNLTYLDLSSNAEDDIHAEELQDIIAVLPQLTKLVSLDLSGNGLGVQGIRILAPVLRQLPNLVSLDLSFNDLGLQGIRILARVVIELQNLTSLDLSGNNIDGEQGMRIFHQFLGQLPPNLPLRETIFDIQQI